MTADLDFTRKVIGGHKPPLQVRCPRLFYLYAQQ